MRSDQDELVITIGKHIIVQVIKISGEQVRLGITAPYDAIVNRQKSWDLKQGKAEQANR